MQVSKPNVSLMWHNFDLTNHCTKILGNTSVGYQAEELIEQNQ